MLSLLNTLRLPRKTTKQAIQSISTFCYSFKKSLILEISESSITPKTLMTTVSSVISTSKSPPKTIPKDGLRTSSFIPSRTKITSSTPNPTIYLRPRETFSESMPITIHGLPIDKDSTVSLPFHLNYRMEDLWNVQKIVRNAAIGGSMVLLTQESPDSSIQLSKERQSLLSQKESKVECGITTKTND